MLSVQFCKGADGDFWIGGTTLGNEPYFYWMNIEEPMKFNEWNSGNPNNSNGDEDCIELSKAADYKWNDNSCDEKKYFVCEEEISKNNYFA